MSDRDPAVRELKIKSGSVKRLLKEYQSYTGEVELQKLNVDKIAAVGVEEWPLRNARKMLEESEKMVKDSSRRLGQAVVELRNLVVAMRSDTRYSENEALFKAEGVLEEANE